VAGKRGIKCFGKFTPEKRRRFGLTGVILRRGSIGAAAGFG